MRNSTPDFTDREKFPRRFMHSFGSRQHIREQLQILRHLGEQISWKCACLDHFVEVVRILLQRPTWSKDEPTKDLDRWRRYRHRRQVIRAGQRSRLCRRKEGRAYRENRSRSHACFDCPKCFHVRYGWAQPLGHNEATEPAPPGGHCRRPASDACCG